MKKVEVKKVIPESKPVVKKAPIEPKKLDKKQAEKPKPVEKPAPKKPDPPSLRPLPKIPAPSKTPKIAPAKLVHQSMPSIRQSQEQIDAWTTKSPSMANASQFDEGPPM